MVTKGRVLGEDVSSKWRYLRGQLEQAGRPDRRPENLLHDMISFDTFAGPRGRVREADLDSAGLLVLAEQPTPAPELFPALCDSPEDEFYESLDDDGGDSCDLFHECNDEGDVAAMQDQEQDRDQHQEDQATEAPQDAHTQQEQASGGRVRQLVELLTLQSHNVGDARSALVDKLLGVVKVHELLLTRATEEQIADAANDAITDEILASVDLEERRRNELALKEQQQQLAPLPVAASTLFNPGQLSPFRVLELVDVLDSTTGGMVKRVLTNVRRRAPLNARMVRDNEMERTVEFCKFCSAYGDHTAAQHKCRSCGVVGHHRSRSCPYRGAAGATTASSNSNSPADAGGQSVDDQKFCTLCNAWGCMLLSDTGAALVELTVFTAVRGAQRLLPLLYLGLVRRWMCANGENFARTAMRGDLMRQTSIDAGCAEWSGNTGAKVSSAGWWIIPE
ncbi:F-box/WD repeat-containing protein TBL1X [Phytophthora cinnamomi]|uniref:F-box/WD repeat-containing protein TBL1X n=1 Tax=Phytophthora cinnamomi TaxID=4785 RepID=UPI00355A94C7|nr:F-box/WD repeat-containing protein TBL1X [Phytophthora cinnamomi]